MIIKRITQSIFIGFALLSFLLVNVEQNPAIAASVPAVRTISQEKVQALPDSLALELAVDRFLTSMPSGYYTIPTVAGLKTQIEKSLPLLVDVREPAEFQSGHIPSAINIPLRTLAHSLDKIPSDRSVVIYCSSGYRSAMGVMTLHLLGYDNVQGFPPSFAGWQAAGETIAKS